MGGTRKVWLGLVIIMALFVSACVRPIDPTPVPTAFIPSPTPPGAPPPVQATPVPATQGAPGPTFPPDTIAQWLSANMAMVALNLVPFTQLQVGPDDIVGYMFSDAAGNPCVGVAQTTASTRTVWTADFRCFVPGTPARAAPLLFALTNGEPYIAAYGYVDMTLAPNASAVAVQFPDGSSANSFLTNGGFVALRQGLTLPSQAIVIGQNEETVTIIPVE